MSPEFWDTFSESAWNRKPCLLRRPFAEPLVDDGELFAIMQSLSRDFRAFQRLAPLSVFIDGRTVVSDLEPFLPHDGQQSLAAYREHLSRTIGERSLMLTMYSVQYYGFGLWTRARWFLRALYERFGLPARNADLDLFLGRYDRTPGGIHKDFAANFSYVLSERKTMLFWPDERFNTHVPEWASSLRTSNYERYLDSAIRIDAERGDMIFWPRSFWHVGISDGGWTSTLNIALYQKRAARDVAYDALSLASRADERDVPEEMLGAPGSPAVPSSLPREIDEALRALRESAQGNGFVNAARRQWLERTSGGGFNPVPPAIDVAPLQDGDELTARECGPLMTVDARDGQIAIGANGHFIEARDMPQVRRTLTLVQQGAAGTVSELLTHALTEANTGDAANLADVRDLLHRLCRARVLQRAVPPS